MNGFTFVAFTYNQEKYIIQHLESIRYQIENFGKDTDCYFLLCDDCSTDKTAYLCKKWVTEHKNLFKDVNFIIQNKNRGIVNNYLTALSSIKTAKFKILAGDDLYFKNNIFDFNNEYNFVITPVFNFDNNSNISKMDMCYYNMFLHKQSKKADLQSFISKYLKYTNVIYAPGVFYNRVYDINKAIDALKNYKFIEDYPFWNYLFSIPNLTVFIETKPLILYRCDVGISTNTKHPKRAEFLKDEKRLEKEIKTDCSLPKLINPYRYRHKYCCFMSKYFYSKSSYVQNCNENIDNEINSAHKYLNEIIDKTNLWMKGNL